MIISHTFEPGTVLNTKRYKLYSLAFKHLNIYHLDYCDKNTMLFNSLINLRLKGTKCSIEFTEEFLNK